MQCIDIPAVRIGDHDDRLIIIVVLITDDTVANLIVGISV